MADHRYEVGPEHVRLQHHQREEAAILGAVHVDQRVRHLITRTARHLRHAEEPSGQDVGARGPHAQGQQRRVDDGRLAGALPVEQRGGDAARDGQAPHQVAEGGERLVEGPLPIRRRGLGGDHAPPKGAAVVRALLALGATLAVP